MKRWLAILLTTLVLVVIFKDWMTVADYYVNHDYIVENLCVNRYEPAIMCSGVCYLETELQQNHESNGDELPIPSEDKQSSTTFLMFKEVFTIRPPLVIVKRNLIPFEEDDYSFTHLDDIFHPPEFIL